MLEKIKTWLPVFQGFYGSGLEDDNDLEYTLFDSCNETIDEKHKQWLIDEVTDYIDYSDYHNKMADSICEAVSEELSSHELINDYKFEGLLSPKYYNFRNDSIDVEFEVDINMLIEKCKKDLVNFELYLKEHYTSYDGFSSSYSNDSTDWFGTLDDYTDGLIHNDTAHCVGAILSFLLTGDNDFGYSYQDLVHEACSEVYINEFINYDKMIDDFNEEFGTIASDINEVELGIGIYPEDFDPEELARKDLVGQNHFNFEKD